MADNTTSTSVQAFIVTILSDGTTFTGWSPLQLNKAIADKKDDLANDLHLTDPQESALSSCVTTLSQSFPGGLPVTIQDFDACKTVRDIIALTLMRANGNKSDFTPAK